MAVSRVLSWWLPVVSLAALPVAGQGPPPVVSPGYASKVVTIADPCPTFSWGQVKGAQSYDLLIYRLGEEAETADPILRRSFLAGVSSWTPPLEQALERGVGYAWSVRAVVGGAEGDWSPAGLFRVVPGPSAKEIEAALAILRRGASGVAVSPDEPGLQDSRVPTEKAIPGNEMLPLPAAPVDPFRPSDPTLVVDGEVRTLDDDGVPRIWGRGRGNVRVYGQMVGGDEVPCVSGDIKYGLSQHRVDWGSASDACPAGTWVCRFSDLSTLCDTVRPDSSVDEVGCDGTAYNVDPDDHSGWLAGADDNGDGGFLRGESFVGGDAPTCRTQAVWCCWE